MKNWNIEILNIKKIYRIIKLLVIKNSEFWIFSVAPMVWIPHQLVGIPIGYNVTLECFIEAHPTSLNYWTRENDHMITDSIKYK